MNIRALATDGLSPACWENQNLFSASALDYDPSDDAHAHLDLIGHTILAARKAAAEEAAVDVCFGCPLMLACESQDIEHTSNTRNQFIPGVIGGRTEAERKARRAGESTPAVTVTTSVPNPQIAPGDRGPRNQVDDNLVASLTRMGKTSEEIATVIGCSARTVSRARGRMGLTVPRTRTTAPASPVAVETARAADVTTSNHTTGTAVKTDVAAVTEKTTTTFTQISLNAETAERTQRAIRNAAQHASSPEDTTSTGCTNTATPVQANPFRNGRTISGPMEAVYNHLTAVGGTDTLDRLLAVAIPHVDPVEAIDWWTKHNSITDANGTKVLRSTKANTPVSERIREGARAKVFNAISATHRKGRFLDRDGDTYTFKAYALAAWAERLNEPAPAAA